jgi:hypothetical protein
MTIICSCGNDDWENDWHCTDCKKVLSPEMHGEMQSEIGRRLVSMAVRGKDHDTTYINLHPAHRVSLKKCPRCGGYHSGIVFKPFEKPVRVFGDTMMIYEATHYAICPDTHEPIMGSQPTPQIDWRPL